MLTISVQDLSTRGQCWTPMSQEFFPTTVIISCIIFMKTKILPRAHVRWNIITLRFALKSCLKWVFMELIRNHDLHWILFSWMRFRPLPVAPHPQRPPPPHCPPLWTSILQHLIVLIWRVSTTLGTQCSILMSKHFHPRNSTLWPTPSLRRAYQAVHPPPRHPPHHPPRPSPFFPKLPSSSRKNLSTTIFLTYWKTLNWT